MGTELFSKWNKAHYPWTFTGIVINVRIGVKLNRRKHSAYLLVPVTRWGRYSFQKAHCWARGPCPTATDLSASWENLGWISRYSLPLGVCKGQALRLLCPGDLFGSLKREINVNMIKERYGNVFVWLVHLRKLDLSYFPRETEQLSMSLY